MKKSNIVLIGMPGCGKSTCGVLLAKIALMDFVDTDLLIQQKEGVRLQNIIDKKGIEKFIEIENSVLASLNVENTIISTGGSAIYSEEGMMHLKENGIVLYIKIDLQIVIERIKDFSMRGIVIRKGDTLEDLLKERAPLYEKYADIVVNSTSADASENVEKMLSAIKEYRLSHNI